MVSESDYHMSNGLRLAPFYNEIHSFIHFIHRCDLIEVVQC